jgi:hypothetical protein
MEEGTNAEATGEEASMEEGGGGGEGTEGTEEGGQEGGEDGENGDEETAVQTHAEDSNFDDDLHLECVDDEKKEGDEEGEKYEESSEPKEYEDLESDRKQSLGLLLIRRIQLLSLQLTLCSSSG